MALRWGSMLSYPEWMNTMPLSWYYIGLFLLQAQTHKAKKLNIWLQDTWIVHILFTYQGYFRNDVYFALPSVEEKSFFFTGAIALTRLVLKSIKKNNNKKKIKHSFTFLLEHTSYYKLSFHLYLIINKTSSLLLSKRHQANVRLKHNCIKYIAFNYWDKKLHMYKYIRLF